MFSKVSKLLGFSTTLDQALQTFAMLMASCIVSFFILRRVDKRKFGTMGLHVHAHALSELAHGILLGFVILTLSVLIPFALGHFELSLAELDFTYLITGLSLNVLLFIIVGFNEEVLFRGYTFQTLMEGIGEVPATVLFSVLFGCAHLLNPNTSALGITNIILAGILLSIAYLKTKSLWLPIGIHFGWNFTQGYIWGMRVSGTTVEMPLFNGKPVEGSEWMTGGSFGPEGGALCTIVCLLASVYVWKFFKPTDEMNRITADGKSVMPFTPTEIVSAND